MKNREYSYAATCTTELRNGESTRVYVGSQAGAEGATEVADIRFGASKEYDEQGALLPGSHLMIIDLRSAEKLSSGASVYEGQAFDPSVAFLAIDPAQVDWKEHTGYKGIRAGETVMFGRESHTSRFPASQETTSRKHFSVMYDQESGTLSFGDHSTNGTTITSGHLEALGKPVDYEDTEIVDTQVIESEVRTLDKQARILDAAYVAQKGAEWRTDRSQPPITHDVLAAQGLEPIVGVGIGEKEFMFSGLVESGTRLHSICYAKNDKGEIVPHMYYKSNSDGGWRMAPYLYEDGVYSKGGVQLQNQAGELVEYGQYSQATKPDESISALLEEMERMHIEANAPNHTKATFRSLLRQSSYERSGVMDHYASSLHIECVPGYGLDAYVSGKGFTHSPDISRGMIEAMRLPEGLTPDFQGAPYCTYQTEHTMLGKTRVEVYLAEYQGKEVEWHVASDDQTGTVWLDRLAVKGGGVTSYGTRQDLMLAGALNAKPVDYRSQARQMVEGEDYDAMPGGTYVSVKKTLDRMPWVRSYRQAKEAQQQPKAAMPPEAKVPEFIDHIPDEVLNSGRNQAAREVAAREAESRRALERHVERIKKLFAFPESRGKDRFGNSLDERRRVTATSEQDAAFAYRFAPDDIRQMIRARAGDKWQEADMPAVLRNDDVLRAQIGEYLLEKAKTDHYMPARIAGNEQKRPSHRGYEYANLSSQEYAALLAVSMLDGTFKSDGGRSDPIELSYGQAVRGQHRYAALQLLGLDRSPYREKVGIRTLR